MAAREKTEDTPRDDTCSPCRGTGTVISNLGGTAQPVVCPWCGGSGRRRPAGETAASSDME